MMFSYRKGIVEIVIDCFFFDGWEGDGGYISLSYNYKVDILCDFSLWILNVICMCIALAEVSVDRAIIGIGQQLLHSPCSS